MVVCLSTVGTGSHEGAGVLHRIEGQLDGLHYQHILQNVTVPSVRMLYPDGIIHLQQDHSSIHDYRVVQERIALQADVGLLEWPRRAADMNPIEKTWSEVKRTMQETWPVLPEIAMSYGPLCRRVGWSWFVYALHSIIESMTRRIKSVVEAEGFWTSY